MSRKSATVSPDVAGDEPLAVDIPPAARVPKIRLITRTQIHPDPEQPRQAADTELRASIARNGLLQPITVRQHPSISTEWMIVDGERRWRSSEGVLNDLPCIVRQDMDALARRLATQLEANTGKSLTPLEEARAFAQIMAHEEISTSELAAFLGRAPSTVAERVALLELGPWLAAIDSGALTMSHAVKVLLPLRRVSDDVHAQVMERMYGGDLTPDPDGNDMTVDDFRRSVHPLYKPFLYPLTKSKSFGAKNPEFKTTKHDQECGCGVLKVALEYGGERAYCGNPEWWKPRHAEAVKAAKAKAKVDKALGGADAPPDALRVYLPEGASVRKVNSWDSPSDVVVLTDRDGRWWPGYGHSPIDFNPAELAGNCSAKDLVELRGSAREYPRVAVRADAESIMIAREAWAARWAARRQVLAEELQMKLAGALDQHTVIGEGARTLLIALVEAGRGSEAHVLLDVAQAMGRSRPEVTDQRGAQLDAIVLPWLESMSRVETEVLANGLAALFALDLAPVFTQIEEEKHEALAELSRKKVPWLKAPKGKKGKAAPSPLAVAGKKLSAETLPLALDDDDEDDGGWASSDADDDGDDLWDAGVDEDDEEEAPLVEARKR